MAIFFVMFLNVFCYINACMRCIYTYTLKKFNACRNSANETSGVLQERNAMLQREAFYSRKAVFSTSVSASHSTSSTA
jgi:hypothetical protein